MCRSHHPRPEPCSAPGPPRPACPSRARRGWKEDLDFNQAVADEQVAADAWQTWRGEVAHARDVYADLDLDATVDIRGKQHETRDIVVHLVEEYARHVGHADLLRECIDGRAGQ